LALILFLYGSKNGVRWVWPLPGSKVGTTAGKLLRLTGPIALSEVLWGMSTFIYTVVFTRLGTTKLAASQIVLSLESIFIRRVSPFLSFRIPPSNSIAQSA
jgi:Na+-driven multidrug efflux pump